MTANIEAILQDGRDANHLLGDETFQRVIGHLRSEIVTQWRATATGSASLREALFHQMQAIDTIHSLLTLRVANAEHEAKKIERANDPTPRVRVVP